MKNYLRILNLNFILVLADKAPNNAIPVCRKYHFDTLFKEPGLGNAKTVMRPRYYQQNYIRQVSEGIRNPLRQYDYYRVF